MWCKNPSLFSSLFGSKATHFLAFQMPLISWHQKENTKLATTRGEKDRLLFEKAPKTGPPWRRSKQRRWPGHHWARSKRHSCSWKCPLYKKSGPRQQCLREPKEMPQWDPKGFCQHSEMHCSGLRVTTRKLQWDPDPPPTARGPLLI